MISIKPQNIINLRYDYVLYEQPNMVNFVEYRNHGNSEIEIKQMLIFIQYYDENHKNEQCFATNLLKQNKEIDTNIEWLIITDCNIPSSTVILNSSIKYRNLIGLDLSFNNICDFGSIAHFIKNSPNLRYLDLTHNPIQFQKDLKDKILMANPGISVINRKRVTPTDFYNISIRNPKFKSNEFQLNQIHAAIRTIQKNRIYPSDAEKNTNYYDDSDYNLMPNYIDTYEIKAIDLSHCNLIYFDFTLFPNAFFIDISHNKIKSEHNLNFRSEANHNLYYLKINGNDLKNEELFKTKFPYCIIHPFHTSGKNYSLLQSANSVDDSDIEKFSIEDLTNSNDSNNRLMSFATNNSSEFIIYIKKNNERIKFIENNELIVKNTLELIFTYTNSEKLNNFTETENIQFKIIEGDSNFLIDKRFSPLCPLYFITELNLAGIPINENEFGIIFKNCCNLRKLKVQFLKITDKNNTVADIYFGEIEKNIWRNLTDLHIIFDNYLFDTNKKYNKFIKKIAKIRFLRNFTITGYNSSYSENDEIDTTFKYLRALNTFNGYRNLIPPTPAQYYAMRNQLPNQNSNDNANSNDNSNSNNDKTVARYQNLNNLSYLIVYDNDFKNPKSLETSKVLPIRSISILDSNGKEIEEEENVKKLVNDNYKFFDQYPRLKYVNNMRIKKDLKTKNREDSMNENKAFESWTSKVDKVFNFLFQVQFFIIYSFNASGSFVSKLLYFFYSVLIKIERFFIEHHITLSTDFTSSCERIFMLSFAPILAFFLLFWEPSYEIFIDISKNKKKPLIFFISTALGGTSLLIFFAFLDSKYFEKEIIFFPYLAQFALFSFILGLVIGYYFKNIRFHNNQYYYEDQALQDQNSFQAYLEFKFFKSKIAYSFLIILIFPVCEIIFNSKLSFTFVDAYKLLLTSVVITYTFYLLFANTNDQCSKIIDYLDLGTVKEEKDDKNNDDDDDDGNNKNDDENRTHYLVLTNTKVSSPSKIFDGAFQYEYTPEDENYKKFADEFRTPTQIFYSSYRYRGIQKFCGFFEVLQRFFTELITKYCARWLFIVPLIFSIYVAVWWPNYDKIINITTLLTSLGKVFMSLFNFLFYYFGVESNKRLQSFLTYMNILGIALNVIGIILLILHTLHEMKKSNKSEGRNDISDSDDIDYLDDNNDKKKSKGKNKREFKVKKNYKAKDASANEPLLI